MRRTFFTTATIAFFAASLALAQVTPSAPSSSPAASGPYLLNPLAFFQDFYNISLALGGLLAFGIIVYAGVEYAIARGNPGLQSDAKDRITQALLGLVLLLSAFMIIRFVDPELLTIKLPGLEPIELVEQDAVAFSCEPLSVGPGSPAALQGTCFAAVAEKASGIARKESSGNPFLPSGVDKCQPGGESVSWGLFQINISANSVGGLNCQAAFDRRYTGNNHQCTVVNQQLYNDCVAAAKDPVKNIEAACRIYREGGNTFRFWGANSTCRF